MITKNNVIPLFLQVCPSFHESWRIYLNSSDYEENLLHIHLGKFASHLIYLVKINSINEFKIIFNTVEQMIINSDAYVKNAIIVSLLETLQNVAEDNGINPESFVSYLKLESLKWWTELKTFWNIN